MKSEEIETMNIRIYKRINKTKIVFINRLYKIQVTHNRKRIASKIKNVGPEILVWSQINTWQMSRWDCNRNFSQQNYGSNKNDW